MSNILFDEEQQKQLRANHWVKSVTEKSISFTEDFKVYFINEYNLGKLPKQIFKDAGFDTGNSETPVTPVMVGDSAKAKELSKRLFDEGVFALAIVFPTVPKGKERLRTIVTAGHTHKDLEFAAAKFAKVGKEMGLIK